MAYADYTFYVESYYGDILDEGNADRWLDRASDEMDVITFGRLEKAFPTNARDILRIRKATCAMAEDLYRIDEAAKAGAMKRAADGTYRGPVTSVSAGGESFSYSSSSKDISVYAAAAASEPARQLLLRETAARYLARIPDAGGTFLLYAGYEREGEGSV